MPNKKEIPRIRIEAPDLLKMADKDLTREGRKEAARQKKWFLSRKRNNGEYIGNAFRRRTVGKGL